MYPKFALMRFLRLQPLQMLCIALCMFVLPHLGTGIVWNSSGSDGSHCFEGAGAQECAKYWWTNLLFVQNLDEFYGKCFGHAWYLAVDFQLYLITPFFCLAYSIRRIFGWALIGIGLLVGISCPVIIAATYDFIPDALLGGDDQMKKVYMKPWCRCTAFFVGIALAWLWQEGLQEFAFRHRTRQGAALSYALSFIALSLLAVTTFGRVAFYQGDMLTLSDINTNPAGKWSIYAFAALSPLAWALGIGIIMVLCFQQRFLPVLQNLLNSTAWQPFAKLSYAMYLVHTSVLILDYCQQTGLLTYTNSSFFFKFLSAMLMTIFVALGLHLGFEKPIANMQMKLFGGPE